MKQFHGALFANTGCVGPVKMKSRRLHTLSLVELHKTIYSSTKRESWEALSIGPKFQ